MVRTPASSQHVYQVTIGLYKSTKFRLINQHIWIVIAFIIRTVILVYYLNKSMLLHHLLHTFIKGLNHIFRGYALQNLSYLKLSLS